MGSCRLNSQIASFINKIYIEKCPICLFNRGSMSGFERFCLRMSREMFFICRPWTHFKKSKSTSERLSGLPLSHMFLHRCLRLSLASPSQASSSKGCFFWRPGGFYMTFGPKNCDSNWQHRFLEAYTEMPDRIKILLWVFLL